MFECPSKSSAKRKRICLIMDSISSFVFLFYQLCLQPCPAWLVHFVAPTLLVPLEGMLEMLEVEVPRLSPLASLPGNERCVAFHSISMSKSNATRHQMQLLEVCDLRVVSWVFYLCFRSFLYIFVPCCRFWFYPGCQEISCLSCLAGRVPGPQLPRFVGFHDLLECWECEQIMNK